MALTFKVINSNGKFVEAVTIIFFRFHETEQQQSSRGGNMKKHYDVTFSCNCYPSNASTFNTSDSWPTSLPWKEITSVN